MENTIERRYVSIDELMLITGLGKNRTRDLGTLAGARIKFGRRTLYDIQKVTEYLATLTVNR